MQSHSSLKVYIHYDDNDRETVDALVERLAQDGVTVLSSGTVETLTRESHVVLFCLSKQFNKSELRTRETQSAFNTMTSKRGGETRLIPVRLENSNMPASLRRWQSVDLFESNGYERLMIALKLRADQVGASLIVRDDWRIPFLVEKKETQAEIDRRNKRKQGRIAWALLFAAVAILVVRNRVLTPPEPTPIPAEVLAANATQNALNSESNLAATLTADVFAVIDPLTQTAAYLTGVPLTQTAEYVISLYTPTVTVTSTLTPTPRTIVVLPTEIMDGNNIPMVLVPEGGFLMGSDDQENTSPVYNIYLLGYYIDKYEVTNAMYQPCVGAGACQPPRSSASATHSDYYGNPEFDDYPVINVDWEMAGQFCEWRGARLPTEAEWEKAARGLDARAHPWGEDVSCAFANYADAPALCVGDTVSVGSYIDTKSPYGTFDMAGNVFEWVSSLYMPYPFNSLDGREDPAASGERVLRGGAWTSSLDEVFTFYRYSMDPSRYAVAGNDVGFRCARDATP